MTQRQLNDNDPTVRRCRALIAEHTRHAHNGRNLARLAQTLGLLSVVVAPVAAAVLDGGDSTTRAIRAGLAAVGGLCVGLLSIFSWQEDWLRHGLARANLERELHFYEAGARDEYKSAVGDEAFARRVEAINDREWESFRKAIEDAKKPQ